MESILEKQLSSSEGTEKVEKRCRRKTCIVCGRAFPYSYMTLFTSVPEKRKKWINLLSENDDELRKLLESKLSNARRYLCYDHFPEEELSFRPNGNIEVTRYSNPEPYDAESFVELKYEKLRPTPSSQKSNATEDDNKISRESIIEILDVINYYIEKAMEDASSQII